MADLPFVGAMTISFLDTPHLDFDLGGLANAFDVPGISLLLRHIIQDQLEQAMVLPNSMTISLSKYLVKLSDGRPGNNVLLYTIK